MRVSHKQLACEAVPRRRKHLLRFPPAEMLGSATCPIRALCSPGFPQLEQLLESAGFGSAWSLMSTRVVCSNLHLFSAVGSDVSWGYAAFLCLLGTHMCSCWNCQVIECTLLAQETLPPVFWVPALLRPRCPVWGPQHV